MAYLWLPDFLLTQLPNREPNHLKIRLPNLLAPKLAHQAIQPVLVAQKHLIRFLLTPLLENLHSLAHATHTSRTRTTHRPNLTLLRKHPYPPALKVLHQPRMINLQALRRPALPRQPALAAPRLHTLHDGARQRREAECAELEDPAGCELGPSAGMLMCAQFL